MHVLKFIDKINFNNKLCLQQKVTYVIIIKH